MVFLLVFLLVFPLPKRGTNSKKGRAAHVGTGQTKTTRGPQVLAHVSIDQGSVLGTYF